MVGENCTPLETLNISFGLYIYKFASSKCEKQSSFRRNFNDPSNGCTGDMTSEDRRKFSRSEAFVASNAQYDHTGTALQSCAGQCGADSHWAGKLLQNVRLNAVLK